MDAHSKMVALSQDKRGRKTSGLAAIVACALGFACGELASKKTGGTLPAAGSARDDGSGLLAAMSMGPMLGSSDKKGAKGGNNYAYTSEYATGGASYGGYGYAGATYGGSIYANYRFSPTYNSRYVPLPNQYASGYSIQTVEDGGAIEGTVTWPKPPRAAASLPKASPRCAEPPANNTLQLSGGKVAGAVVYLDDIRKGRSHPNNGQTRKMQLGGLVVRSDCSMFPRMQVVAPIGAALAVRSKDKGKRVTRVGYYSKPELASPEAEHSVETLSEGAERELRLDSAGFYGVAQGSDYRAGSWLVVAGHPYYTSTDAQGRFQLEDIPPGTYTLVVWHPSVYLGDGKWSESTVVKRKVSVKPYGTTKTSVALK